ncbi:MAG: ABC transporter permease [Acidobacteria bacterium]|nr:ABC transporter permease [Acidobacteriota bacterium]
MAWHHRIANVFRSRKISRDLDDELAFHIAERTDELVAKGMSERDARREAARLFGSYTLQKEETGDMDIARALEAFVGDLKYGVRQLRLNPGFATVAVLSLALGIGANSGIFQLINALRLKGLPVARPAELVAIEKGPDFFQSGWFEARNPAYTYAQIERITEQQKAFIGVSAFGTAGFNLSKGGEAVYAEALFVTPNFLDVLGVKPVLGGWLTPETDPRDCSGAGALLDYNFWQRQYGGDLSVVGREISLNGRSFPILGVTPASFAGVETGRRFEVAVPVCADGIFSGNGQGRLTNKTAWWLTPIARLKPEWTVDRADAHMREISPVIFRETQPESYRADGIEKYLNNKLTAVPAGAGVSSLRERYEGPLLILLVSTGLVLLIACANLANLLLARASVREREMALRQAVGASSRRVVAQLMSESLLLAGIGAAFGAWLAYLLGRGLVLFLRGGGEQLEVPLGLDWRVVGFTAALALATCLLFGLAPALRATRTAPADAMWGGRGSASSAERNGLRRALVVAQIWLSLVLLVGALLFGQSLRNLMSTDTGIVTEGVLAAGVNSGLLDLGMERQREVYRRLEERFNALPGVVSAATVSNTPFGGNSWNESAHADDDAAATGGKNVWLNRVGPGYFRTMGTPLLAGRDFGAQDSPKAPKTAIVNQEMAEEFFGGADPVGRTFRTEAYAGSEDPVYQIVGLVTDTKYGSLREEQRAIAFLPWQEEAEMKNMNFVIRSQGGMGDVMTGVKGALAEIDPALLVEFDVLDVQVQRTVLRERLMATLSGGFGFLAALLSALGLYGVMSYMVARRRNEIGVRMALGAQPSDVRRLVFGEAGRLVLVGLAIGLASSFALTRYAESLLYGLQPNDLKTLALGCGLLAATAFVATSLPVRRATKLDPATVLRDE